MLYCDLEKMTDANEAVDILINGAPEQAINDGVSDYILVELFFSTLGDTFNKREEVTSDEVENFKKSFDYKTVGIVGDEVEKLVKKLEKMKSIDRIISLIEKRIPSDRKKEIIKDHIRRVWLESNFQNNLQGFISGLNKEYWGLE